MLKPNQPCQTTVSKLKTWNTLNCHLITGKQANAFTVRRLEELSVLTQYLFHSISNNLRSRDDLKYDTSSE